jgi:ribosomal protein S18 acetylase RimI-like enzyme
VFSSESYPQLYRTWSPYEVTDNLSTDGELCLVAEEVRKLPPKRGRRPKEYKEHAKKVVGFILGSVTEKKKKQEGCAYLAWVAVNEEYQRYVWRGKREGRREEVKKRWDGRKVSQCFFPVSLMTHPSLLLALSLSLPSLRQGIGTELVGTIEALFKKEGMATIVADTPESNVPARRFLEKLGFANPISVSL